MFSTAITGVASVQGAVSILAAVATAYLAIWLARSLPARMDRQWRNDCNEYLATPAAVVAPASKAERGVAALVAALLAFFCIVLFGTGWTSGVALVFCLTLLVLAFIDIRSMLLPDVITLPLVWAGLLISVASSQLLAGSQIWFLTPSESIVGAVAGYGSLWVIGKGFATVTGRDGIGGGDLKLLAALGAWLGWTALPVIAFIAACSGLVVALIGMAAKRGGEVPFGPHLALGGMVVLFGSHGAAAFLPALQP